MAIYLYGNFTVFKLNKSPHLGLLFGFLEKTNQIHLFPPLQIVEIFRRKS